MHDDPYQLLANELVLVLLKDYRRAKPTDRPALRACLTPDAPWVRYCVYATGLATPGLPGTPPPPELTPAAQRLIAGIVAQLDEIDTQGSGKIE